MTVCGGPREENLMCVEENPMCVEENLMCVEENPTGLYCCCPWPRKCLHLPLQKQYYLSACFC